MSRETVCVRRDATRLFVDVHRASGTGRKFATSTTNRESQTCQAIGGITDSRKKKTDIAKQTDKRNPDRKLKVTKETLKDLAPGSQTGQIKGGATRSVGFYNC